MAEAKLKEIAFTIICDCGKEFRAEDFEPECPYCDRKYLIKMSASMSSVNLSLIS